MDPANPQHRFSTLGPVALVKADGTADSSLLDQPERIALLAFLRLSGDGSPVTRDAVLSTFWPGIDPERAGDALSRGIRTLRKSLGADVVEGRGDHMLHVPPERVWCDAAELERLAGMGRHEDVVRLYGGPFLDDLDIDGPRPLEDWIERTRAELAQKAERATAELGARREGEEAADPAGAEPPRRADAPTPRDRPVPLPVEPPSPEGPPRRWPPGGLVFVALVSLFLALIIALILVLPHRL
jgi:DNA-binding SARP family transcriptional activator